MQYGVLLGMAAAVLLASAVSAVVLYRGSPVEHRTEPPTIAAAPGDVRRAPDAPAPNPAVRGPVAPSFDIVKVGPTGTAVIAGRAEPGSRVVVRDGEKVIGAATADRRGEWVLVPDQPIPPGDRLLSLEASPAQGGETVKSGETVALSIAPGKQSETALAVVLPRDGGAAARVLQRPEPGPPNALSMEVVEYDSQGRMILSGRATPGSTVQVYIGNEQVSIATADATGLWSAISTKVPGRGRAELRLDQLGEGGGVVQRLSLPLEQAAAAQLAAGQAYVVQRGNSLWQIAKRTYGNGVRYLVIYSANLGQIRDPERIYPGQIIKLPKS